MTETTGEKISRIIKEKDMHLKVKEVKHLTIYDLRQDYYTRFIDFIKTEVPTQQGYDGLMLLLESYERYKISDKLISRLESEIAELKAEKEKETENGSE